MPDTVGTIEVHLVDAVSFQKVADIIEAGKLMAAALETIKQRMASTGYTYLEGEETWQQIELPVSEGTTLVRALAAWEDITKGAE